MPDKEKLVATGFRIDKDRLWKFQSRLKATGADMSPVIVSWIDEYLSGARTVPGESLPTEGRCPVCESTLKVTPKGMALVQIGPLEPMSPGEIPAELMGLVRNFVEAYSDDEIFRQLIDGIMVLRTRK